MSFILNNKLIHKNSVVFLTIFWQVEFVIGYTSRGELTNATVNVVLTDVDPDQLLLQTHSVQFQVVCYSHRLFFFFSTKWASDPNTPIPAICLFQLAAPSPTPGELIPGVGLKVGSPVVGLFDGEVKPVSSWTT